MSDDDLMLEYCLMKFDELTNTVTELDDDMANARPYMEDANSPVAILAHCCGMMRRWSSSVNLGVPVPRDRESEFAVRMSVGDAKTLAKNTRSAFEEDVRKTTLDQVPAEVPPGRGAFWTVTCRGVLFHVFEELCQHLGQAEVTRDLLKSDQTR